MSDDLAETLERSIDSELDTVLDYARRKNVDEQRRNYAEDPLFSRFNLDTREFVLAKSGGGLVTSIHRKVGDLIERNVQRIFAETYDLDDVTYDASIVVDGEEKVRELDALLLLDEADGEMRQRLQRVIDEDAHRAEGDNASLDEFAGDGGREWRGMGFEIRHCYQSADSKRAQADVAMANHLRNDDVLPVMLIFCEDSNRAVVSRYRNHMYVSEGRNSFDLVERLTGFDYADFLDEREAMIDGKMDDVFEMF